MKLATLICVGCVGLSLATTPAAAAPTVTIKTVSGDITIIGSTKAKCVSGDGQITGNKDAIRVRAAMPSDDLTVTVPPGYEVRARSVSGDSPRPARRRS